VRSIVFGAWAALLLSVQPGLGQKCSTITLDDRVRITLEDDQQVTGAVVAQEERNLVILVSDSSQRTVALLGNAQADAGGGINTATAIAIGAGVGAIAGAIIGSGPKREQWVEVPLESLSLGYGPVGNGKCGLVASFFF